MDFICEYCGVNTLEDVKEATIKRYGLEDREIDKLDYELKYYLDESKFYVCKCGYDHSINKLEMNKNTLVPVPEWIAKEYEEKVERKAIQEVEKETEQQHIESICKKLDKKIDFISEQTECYNKAMQLRDLSKDEKLYYTKILNRLKDNTELYEDIKKIIGGK